MLAVSHDGYEGDWVSLGDCGALRQFYASVKGIMDWDKDASVWIGKRFYRREDIHITDKYYHDVSGNGAGIENVALGSGKLSFNWVTNDQADIKLALKNNVSDRDILDKTFNEDTYSWDEEKGAGVWKHEPSYKTAGVDANLI